MNLPDLAPYSIILLNNSMSVRRLVQKAIAKCDGYYILADVNIFALRPFLFGIGRQISDYPNDAADHAYTIRGTVISATADRGCSSAIAQPLKRS